MLIKVEKTDNTINETFLTLDEAKAFIASHIRNTNHETIYDNALYNKERRK